jgi:hypothetical protein
VIYVVENGGPSGQGRLYSARLDGSTGPVLLNAGASEAGIGSIIASPDGGWVLYRDSTFGGFGRRLFGVPIDASAPPVRLNPVSPAGDFYGFDVVPPRFTPDGSRAVYLVDQHVVGERELFSVPVDGGAPPVQLSAPLPAGSTVLDCLVTLDGTEVVYAVRATSSSTAGDLFVVPILGGSPRQLNPPDEGVNVFQLSPDGVHVACLRERAGEERLALVLASLVPGANEVPLTGFEVYPFWGSRRFVFDSAGEHVAYMSGAYYLDVAFLHLNVVRTSGARPPERLDLPGLLGSSVIRQPQLGGQSHWVSYALDDTLAVYTADLDRDKRLRALGKLGRAAEVRSAIARAAVGTRAERAPSGRGCAGADVDRRP